MQLSFDFPRVSQFVSALTNCTIPSSGGAAIGLLRDDEIVAGVLYEDFTGEGGSITATISVAPGAVMTKEFVSAIFAYPFKQLGVGKIIALVSSTNWKSARLVKHMGFVETAVVQGYYPDADLIVFEMSAANCRWLGEEHGKG
jgi:RimJ/RimL family protein N-acetyltransferase